MTPPLPRRLLAEFLGAALLAAIVIGSGIAAYIPAQVGGCIAGAVLANAMFAQPAVSIAATHRATPAHLLAEIVATIGLLLVTFALVRTGRAATAPAGIAPASVPPYIVAQRVGAGLAVAVIRTLYPDVTPAQAADVVLPHTGQPHRAEAHERRAGEHAPETA